MEEMIRKEWAQREKSVEAMRTVLPPEQLERWESSCIPESVGARWLVPVFCPQRSEQGLSMAFDVMEVRIDAKG